MAIIDEDISSEYPDDVSYDAIRVARILDRQDPGMFMIILDKTPKDSDQGWDLQLHEITPGTQFHMKRKVRGKPKAT